MENRVNEPEFLDELALEYLPGVASNIAELVREHLGLDCTRNDVRLALRFLRSGPQWVATVHGRLAYSHAPVSALEALRKRVLAERAEVA